MKTTAVLVKSLLVVAAFGMVVPGFAQYGSSAKARAKGADETSGNPTAPTNKDDEEGKIVGVEIGRANGGFLGLSIASGGFKLAFYNAKKKTGRHRRCERGRPLAAAAKKGNELAPLKPQRRWEGAGIVQSRAVSAHLQSFPHPV